MYYGDQKASLVKLSDGLRNREWKIYGFKEDLSDSQTDYFDPAYWGGIAVKNGYILVVDNYSGGSIGGDFIKKSYDYKLQRRIVKLQTLADNHAATEGERENALSMIAKFDSKVVSEILVQGDLPPVEYQKNPKGSKWHIEKNGEILAKGLGIYAFGDVNTWREESIIFKDMNDMSHRTYWNLTTQEQWDKDYQYGKEKEAKKSLLLDKYFKLLDKWENIAVIKLGDGDEDKLIKKTIEKKSVYFIPKDSEKPTDYLRVGDKWRHFHGVQKNLIYKISDDRQYIKKLTLSWTTFNNDESCRTYKKEPNKNTKGNFNVCSEEDFKNGDIVYVELVERIEITHEVIYVRESKKATKSTRTKTKKATATKNTNIKESTQIKETEVDNSTTNSIDTLIAKSNNKDFEDLIKKGSIKDFEHTKTHDILKVFVLGDILNKDDFKCFLKHFTYSKLGYYSRIAGGFVLKAA